MVRRNRSLSRSANPSLTSVNDSDGGHPVLTRSLSQPPNSNSRAKNTLRSEYSLPSRPEMEEMSMDGTVNRRRQSRPFLSIRRFFRRKRFLRKRKISISASFSMDHYNDMGKININEATEDELMTLRLDRPLARNIISHRKAIGGFKKIEDIALVCGMGAKRLNELRSDVCVKPMKSVSLAGSKLPSLETGSSSDEESSSQETSRKAELNVNLASIFDLMVVDGINQSLASKIINSREKKGSFKNLNDLKKRSGLTEKQAKLLKDRIVFENASINNSSPPKAPARKGHSRSSSYPNFKMPSKVSKILNSCDESSVEEAFKRKGSIGIGVDVNDELEAIFEILSSKTKRPKQSCDFYDVYNYLPAIRLSCWNLEKLSNEKISNPGVLEVICRTILENGLTIVCLQEIMDKYALKRICQELNFPSLPKNAVWKGNRGRWRSCLSCRGEALDQVAMVTGVIYNADLIEKVTCLSDKSTFQLNAHVISAFKVTCKYSSWYLMNVHHSPEETSKSKECDCNHKVEENSQTLLLSDLKMDDQVIVLSNSLSPRRLHDVLNKCVHKEVLHKLEGLKPPIFTDEERSVISIRSTRELASILSDDIGLVRDGLRHLAIPNGWSWGGKAVSSGPFYVTMYDVSKKDYERMSEEQSCDEEVSSIPPPPLDSHLNGVVSEKTENTCDQEILPGKATALPHIQPVVNNDKNNNKKQGG